MVKVEINIPALLYKESEEIRKEKGTPPMPYPESETTEKWLIYLIKMGLNEM